MSSVENDSGLQAFLAARKIDLGQLSKADKPKVSEAEQRELAILKKVSPDSNAEAHGRVPIHSRRHVRIENRKLDQLFSCRAEQLLRQLRN